jgi:hypothetical protein
MEKWIWWTINVSSGYGAMNEMGGKVAIESQGNLMLLL